MSNSKNITLDQAAEAMRTLPKEAQAELAKELVAVLGYGSLHRVPTSNAMTFWRRCGDTT